MVQGRQRRFISADIGGTPVQEIWLGDKQIWPNTEGVATRIVVALPQVGTLDWQYWVHALDSTKYKATPANYMKFVVDGLDFFINHAYDGTTPYRLEGNELSIDLYDGALIDQLGEYLEVKAKIPTRWWKIENSATDGVPVSSYCNLPYLDGTLCSIAFNKGAKKPYYLWDSSITATPGGQTLLVWHYGTGEHKRGWKGKGFQPMNESFVWDGDEKWQIGTAQMYEGAEGMKATHVLQWQRDVPVSIEFQFPAFTRVFKLKIISVE